MKLSHKHGKVKKCTHSKSKFTSPVKNMDTISLIKDYYFIKYMKTEDVCFLFIFPTIF